MDRIPPDGEIAIIADGIEESRRETRRRFQRFLPLSNISAEQRGWTGLTLTVIRQLQKTNFSLKDLYMREKAFIAAYPDNQHVQAKIRQQLQILRNLGILVFKGNGKYSLID